MNIVWPVNLNGLWSAWLYQMSLVVQAKSEKSLPSRPCAMPVYRHVLQAVGKLKPTETTDPIRIASSGKNAAQIAVMTTKDEIVGSR